MRFKDLDEELKEANYRCHLDEELKEANYRCQMADKGRREVLEHLIKAGRAKVIDDGDYDYQFCIVTSPDLLKAIQSMEFDGEDVRYFGIDEDGFAEAKDQGCDPMEFYDEIVLRPGETVDWYLWGRA